MTNKDIFNFASFKTELENLINHYIENGLPATFILPTIQDAYASVLKVSNTEIEQASKEAKEELARCIEPASDAEEECAIGLTD